MKKIVAVPALLGACALVFSGCAQAPGTDASVTSSPAASSKGSPDPSATGTSNGSSDVKACMVSDSGGFNDKSFNETAHNGLTKAVSELGLQTAEMESNDTKDFATNIQKMIDAKCSVIITVGFMMGDATVAAAKAHPDIKFAIVDWADPKGASIANLKELTYNTAESSFMAGYLAAATSKTGTVGTWGAMNIPTVTIFMDGFAKGVEHYNKTKGKQVKVVGWDSAKSDGQFLGGFDDVAGGKRISTQLMNQGADILFPVAGPAGEGALQVAQESKGKVSAIWVDTDGCISTEKYCKSIMTSVYKGMDISVYDVIKSVKDGSFDAKPYVGTLQNEGTGLAPFHDFDATIPADVKADLDKIKADIISGALKVESKYAPKK